MFNVARDTSAVFLRAPHLLEERGDLSKASAAVWMRMVSTGSSTGMLGLQLVQLWEASGGVVLLEEV